MLSVKPSEEFRHLKVLLFGDLQSCLDTSLQRKARRPGHQVAPEKLLPGAYHSLETCPHFKSIDPASASGTSRES